MEIIEQWQKPVSEETVRWYRSSSSPQNELTDILPFGLDYLHEVLPKRKQYIQNKIDRKKLVQFLTQSHLRRKAPQAVLGTIEKLEHDNTYLVVTGQQPGLLGGPLLTVYKIIQAIQLAKRLSDSRDETFLPAFWNAAEDHDLSEINSLNWFSKENRVESFQWEIEDKSQPYFSVAADHLPIDAICEFINNHSHSTEFLEPVLDELKQPVADASSYADVFDRWLWNWFGGYGLIILRPDDEYTRTAAARFMQEEISNPALSSQEINRMGERLEEQGLSAQIHKRDDRTSFFLIQDEKRSPLYIVDDGFRDEQGNIYSNDQLIQMAAEEPEAFSPSAVLRPVIQDAVYPTAAVVLGPSEMKYHALLHPLYERHGVPRPCVAPRGGFTLMEPRMMKWMDQYGLTLDDLQEDSSALVKRFVKQSQSDNEELPKEELLQSVERFFEAAVKKAKAVDESIVKALEKNKGKIEKEIGNSANVIVRKEAAKHETMRMHIEALQAMIHPNEMPQERFYNAVYFLVKFGKDFLDNLIQISQTVEDGSHTYIKVP